MLNRRNSRALLPSVIALLALAASPTAGAAPTFDGGRLVDSGSNEISLAAGDVTGDGWADIATGSSSGTLGSLRNRQDNWFVMGVGWPRSATGSNEEIKLGDVNGDGNLDYLSVSRNANQLHVYLGNGSGGVTGSLLSSSTGVSSTPVDLALADMDGDGDLDVVTANEYPTFSPTVSVMRNDGSGNFTAIGIYTTGAEYAFTRGVAVGDIDGDGDKDVAVVNAATDQVRILLGDGAGGLTLQGTAYATSSAPKRLRLGDLDDDGDLDIVTADTGIGASDIPENRNNRVTVLLNDGSGAFTAAAGSPVVTSPAGAVPIDLELGDLDGDGRLDLAVANRYGGTLSVLAGSGDGRFGSPNIMPLPDDYTGAVVRGIEVTDVNRDGRSDLVANASANPGYLITFLNTTLSPAPVLSGTNPPLLGADPTPDITGTAVAGSTVQLYTTSDCSGAVVDTVSAAALAGGTTVAAAPNTATVYTARATRAGGNWPASVCSNAVTYTHDDIPPSPPSITVSPSGTVNVASATVTGSAEAASTVRIYRSADCTGGSTVISAASFATPGQSFAANQDAVNRFTAIATDAALNSSACSSATQFTEDSTPPTISSMNLVGTSPRNTASVTFSGVAEAGSTVRIHATSDCSDAGVSGTANDYASGIAHPTVRNATTTYSARTTDAAGNQSSCIGQIAFTEDSIAPAAPVVNLSRSGSVNAADVVVSGSAEAGSTVRLHADGTCADGGTTMGASAFATGVTRSLTQDSVNRFSATATDAAGNTSTCAASASLVEDSTAPSVTSMSIVGSNPANAATVRLTGTGEPGTTIEIHDSSACDDVLVSGAYADFASPGLEVTVPQNATTTFYVRAIDAAGNTSSCNLPTAFTEDSIAPAVPTLQLSLSGTVNEDTVDVSGIADVGSSVEILPSADCSGTGPTVSAATYATGITIGLVADSVNRFSVRARDAAGNASPCSTAATVTEDSTAPVTSFISAPSGTVGPGARVVTFAASEPDVTYVCTLDALPSSSCTSPIVVPSVADGVHTLTVVARDEAGNTEAPGAIRTWTVLTPPVADPTPTNPTPTNPTPPVDSVAPKLGITYPVASKLVFRSGVTPTLPLRVACPAGEQQCVYTVTATATVRVGSKLRVVKVGSARMVVTSGAVRAISLRLNAAAKAQLARGKRLAVTLATKVVDAAGNATSGKRVLVLRLRR